MAARLICCLVLLLALCLEAVPLTEIAEHEEKCEQLCVKNQGRGSNLESTCDENCRLEQCNKGCAGRNRSLESSCKHFCGDVTCPVRPCQMDEDPASPRGERWYCVIGCNIAVSRYVQRLRDELQLGAPTLVPDSLTADSVTIRWLSLQLPHATLLVQYKYSDLPGEWMFYQPDVKLNASQVTITGLKPYTKYQFRVLLVVAADQEPLLGAASNPISTLASGRPSAPEALTAAASDAQHVSLRWRPPAFPGGPLVSYLVVLRAGGQHMADEIDPNLVSHVLGDLQPATNYTVTVSAINKDGEGPTAETWVLTPPLAAEVSTQEGPRLIVGTGDVILRLKLDIFSSPQTLYRADEGVSITGTAMDVSAGHLYLATSAGRIQRLSLDGGPAQPTDVTPVGLAGRPALLALDWLAGALYGLVAPSSGDWAVQRWELGAEEARDTGLRFSTRPAHMAVDPQNGYLYYSVAGPGPDAGLFRCSFDNMTSAERVASGDDLNFSTFVIDHTNSSVLVPGRQKNTVFALYMISWRQADIRRDAKNPQYDSMLALAEHARTLCWSSGQHVYLETYRADRKEHYANRFMISQIRRPVISMHVQHPASQPRPAPASPPRELQVVFHSGRALARWQPPALSGLAGPAAWQRWTYQLQLTDSAGQTRDVENVTSTELTVEQLAPDTQYTLQVRALSVSGVGPWSSPFRGRTLEPHLNASGPFLLWSTEVGLLRSDVIGDQPTVLVSRASFNASEKTGIHVSDLTWCDDVMYLATNDSRVYTHNLRSGELRQLGDGVQATALAVDWIGRRLYWSSPKQQLIYGAPLPDSDVTAGTPLPFFTVARHLRVDALRGVLYWATGHTVEASYLNGERRRNLFKTGIFSGKQVVGLTLDLTGDRLFWIVRDFAGSSLHVLPLLDSLDGDSDTGRSATVIPLRHKHVKGPLHFFSGRLLWVMEDESAVIADPDVAHLAVVNADGVTGLRMVSVLDGALHPLPEGYSSADQLRVLPDRIPVESVTRSATDSRVTVRWAAVTNTNFATVTYRAELNGQQSAVAAPEAALAGPLPAFSPIQVALRAVTRWGESPLTQVTLHTPEGTPSEPRTLRVFTLRQRPIADPQNWTAVIRWDAPASPNGIIAQYRLTVWEEDGVVFSNSTVDGTSTEAQLTGLKTNVTYEAEVRAETSAGAGPLSTRLAFEARDVPVPRLLVADEDRLRLVDLDTDRVTDLLTQERVIDLAADVRQQRLFLLTPDNDILSLDLRTLTKHKVESLRGTGSSLAYDWVSRDLFWAESAAAGQYSSIYRRNLDTETLERVAGQNGRIGRLRVDPWTSRLVWTMVGQDGATMLMKRQARDGRTIGQFFGAGQPSDRCNCPSSSSGGRLVALHGRRVLWQLPGSDQLMAADMDGCHCQELSAVPKHAHSMALSEDTMFWSQNATDSGSGSSSGSGSGSVVYSQRLGSSGRRQVYSGRSVRGVWPLDGRQQRYPSDHCLLPGPPAGRPSDIYSRSSSVGLQMSPRSPPADCGAVSAAAIRYTLHYGPNAGQHRCRDELQFCQNTTFVGNRTHLTGLTNLTAYTVRVSVSNYYSDLLAVQLPANSSIIVRTTAPAPAEPRDVTARPLSPEGIEVGWLPPLSSGDRLSYRVHWRTEGASSSLRAFGPDPAASGRPNSVPPRPFKFLPPGLTANTEYQIWVSALSSDGSAASNSSVVTATTYPYPSGISLEQANVTSLTVSWAQEPDGTIQRSWVQYRAAVGGDWLNASLAGSASDSGRLVQRYVAGRLEANSQYWFRLQLIYSSGEPFAWPAAGEFPVFTTAAGRPDRPAPPEVQPLSNSLYQVSWPPPNDNGAEIDLYALEVDSEVRRVRRDTVELEDEDDAGWRLVYNGSDPSWIITGLDPSPNYRFRTRAHNAHGWSAYSAPSLPHHLESLPLTAARSDTPVIVGGVISAACLVIVITIAFLVLRFRHRPEDKKAPRSPDQLTHDLELAQLREIPAHFVRQNNSLYAPPFADAEDAVSLPRVRREHITLTKFLGKGAFGEVYEGLAQQLPGRGEDEDGVRVAIKTLAKGAKDEEKLEFLKEAQLMCNFKHKHIISLLGVCLDNDPYFLLLELMEGGDLLSYLRANRGTDSDGTPILSLNDQLQMCVDVSRGCQYLEQLHFVHRDLAARNCLVTCSEPHRRTVKIGDFGLARDIYKNDYYRKEGEGLLPVRWMSPESLIDGVFASQSDVWAFGVLLWEVMTKGQQPYPARTNLEVLQYVREGGTLSRPDRCPQMMYELMQQCWEYEAEDRPSFAHCLQCLQQIQVAALSQAPGLVQTGMTVHNAQYARTPGAFDNNAYTVDEEEADDDGDAWRRSSSVTSGRDSSYLLADGDNDSVFSDSSAAQATLPSRARLRLPQKHSYLQLRHDSSSGYEVPTGEPAAAVHGATGEAAGLTAPHSYQNCSLAGGLPSTSLAGLSSASLASGLPSTSLAGLPSTSLAGLSSASLAGLPSTSLVGLPSTSLAGLPSASPRLPGPSGCGAGPSGCGGTVAAGTTSSVDDIQFSFDAASELNPRHSVASLLSQISGVAIDVDPGKTSWC